MDHHSWGCFLEYLLAQGPETWNEWVGWMIVYKDFLGSFSFDEEVDLFRGKVANIKDLVTFEGKTLEKTRQAFEEAVDTYLDWCERYGREPEWVETEKR